MNARLAKAILLVILLSGGFLYYRAALRPDPRRLEDFAESALKEIFGPDVTHGSVQVDLLDGVRIAHLKIAVPATGELALWADSVEIQHDVLAMSAGMLRLRSVTIRGAVVAMHETETEAHDLALDFPFHLPTGSSEPSKSGRSPKLIIERGEVRFRAAQNSERLRPGALLVLGNVRLTATPDVLGGLTIDGGFLPRGLGLEPRDKEITVKGTAQPANGQVNLHLHWDPMTITPEMREMLAQHLRAQIEAQHLEVGPKHRLDVDIARDPREDEGHLKVSTKSHLEASPDFTSLPGVEVIDANTGEQLNALFGKIQLDVELSGDRIDIHTLAASLGGGSVTASARIEEDGSKVRVDLDAKDVQIDDPVIRKALGKTGERVFSEFLLHGAINAKIRLEKDKDTPFRWSAEVELKDATVAFRGPPDPVRKKSSGAPVMDGFPYAMEHASGRISAKPGEVIFHGIEGRHGAAIVRIRGNLEKSGRGGETGIIRWTDAGTDVRLTIEASNVPLDADFKAAEDASEIYDMVERFQLGGKLQRLVVDLFQDAGRDEGGKAEVAATMKGNTFTYSLFALPMTDVGGTIRLLRPRRGEKGRSREFHIDATGRVADGTATIKGDLFETDRRGRWHVTATNVRIEGEVLDVASKAAGGFGGADMFLSPTGRADATADFGEFDDPGPATYRVDVREVQVRLGQYGDLPGPMLSEVSGTVTSSGGRVDLTGVSGKLEGSPIRVTGHMDGGPRGAWDMRVEGEGVRVTEGLLATVDSISGGKGLLPSGVALHPGGRMDLDVRLTRAAGDAKEFKAKVDAKRADVTVKIGLLPVRVRGAFRVDGDEVTMKGLTAEGSGVEIRVPNARYSPKGLEGSASASLTDVTATQEVLGLLPESVRAKVADLTRDRLLQAVNLSVNVAKTGEVTIAGRLGLKARPDAPNGGPPRGEVEFAPLVLSKPDANGDRTVEGTIRFLGLALDVGVTLDDARGTVELHQCRLCADSSVDGVLRDFSARIAGLSVERMTAPILWRDGILKVGPIGGVFYGGSLSGDLKVHTRAPAAFEGRATIAGFSLEALHNDLGAGGPDYKGSATVDVDFQSRSGSIHDMTAGGSVRVRDGDLGDLPPIANIPALLATILQLKSKPKFEKADVNFSIEHETIHATSIVLGGPLYKMKGHGTLDFSGWLDVDLSPEFIKNLALPGVMEIPILGDIVGFFSESVLYVIRVRGELKNPKTTLVLLPFINPRRGEPPFQGTEFLGKPTRKVPSLFR